MDAGPSVSILLALSLALVIGSEAVALRSQATVKHGDSYTFQSVLDETFLSSTSHTYREGYGVNVGRVIANEFHGTPNQIWDTIRWPNTPANHFWVFPKAASLNEITAVDDIRTPIPAKNLIEFVHVASTESRNNSTLDRDQRPFLIRSVELNSCVQNQGLDFEIAYKPCDPSQIAQHWLLEHFYEDKNAFRSKAKFYCKFSG